MKKRMMVMGLFVLLVSMGCDDSSGSKKKGDDADLELEKDNSIVAADTTAEEIAEENAASAEGVAEFLAQTPPLQGWIGEWISLESFLDDSEMDAVYEAVSEAAEEMEKSYTPKEVKSAFAVMFAADFTTVTITENEISYYDAEGELVETSTYVSSGQEPMAEHEGAYWNSFEAVDDTATHAYLVATAAHGDTTSGPVHWHMRYSDESIAAVVNHPNPGWYPTLYSDDITVETVVESYVAVAPHLAHMLPDKEQDTDVDGDTDSGTDTDSNSDSDADSETDVDVVDYCLVADGTTSNECNDCFPDNLDSETLSALHYMFPDADEVISITEETETYFAASHEGERIGYAFLSESNGFEGPLVTLTGVHTSGTTIMVDLTEFTTGEWEYRLSKDFYSQFACIDLSTVDVPNRDWGENNVDMVSGATISSSAVERTVWQSLEKYLALDQ